MARKQVPVIDLATDFWKDARAQVIAVQLGIDLELVQCRIIKLWSWCRDQGLKNETPAAEDPGWLAADSLVNGLLGHPAAAAAMLESGLAVRWKDGRLYLTGSEQTVRNLRSARAKGRKSPPAGDAPTETAGTQREDISGTSGTHRASESDLKPSSGTLAAPPLPLTPSLRSESTYTRERAAGAGALARKLQAAAVAGFGDLTIAKCAPRGVGVWVAMPKASDQGWQMLLDRCEQLLATYPPDEAEAKGLNRVAVAVASAKDAGNGQFYTPGWLWDRDSFFKGVDMDPLLVGRNGHSKDRHRARSAHVGRAPLELGNRTGGVVKL